MKKKLVLKKEVVASLDNGAMKSLVGGAVYASDKRLAKQVDTGGPGDGGDTGVSATQCGIMCDGLPTGFAVCGNQTKDNHFGCPVSLDCNATMECSIGAAC